MALPKDGAKDRDPGAKAGAPPAGLDPGLHLGAPGSDIPAAGEAKRIPVAGSDLPPPPPSAGERIQAALGDIVLAVPVALALLGCAFWLSTYGWYPRTQVALRVIGTWGVPAVLLLVSLSGFVRTPGWRFMSHHDERVHWLRRLVVIGAGIPSIVAIVVIARSWLFIATLPIQGQEWRTNDRLFAIRGTIEFWLADHDRFPAGLDDPEFRRAVNLTVMPGTDLGVWGHPASNVVETYPFTGPDGSVDPALLRDTGHWLYDPVHGLLIVDCTHYALTCRSEKPIWAW